MHNIPQKCESIIFDSFIEIDLMSWTEFEQLNIVKFSSRYNK